MGLGQMLMSVLSLVLLGTIFLNTGNIVVDQRAIIEQCQYEIMATSLARSIVERANGLAFDAKTVSAETDTITGFSSTLGIESGEIASVDTSFDDFDDYNGYDKTVDDSTLQTAKFHIWATVVYVDTNSTGAVVKSSTRTYHKCLTVHVSSPSMRDTVRYSTVFSFWYFR